MFFQGHFADAPPPNKTMNPPKSFTKRKPDYMAYIREKKEVTALDMARKFLITTQTARIAFVELEKQGLVERLPKSSVHDTDTFRYITG